MRLLIFILVALAAVVALALIAQEDPGLVVISRAPYEIEISLALFGIFLVIAFVLLYLAFRFLSRMYQAPSDMRKYNQRKRVEKAQNETLRGYAGLIQGDWDKAEKQLTKRLEHSPTPMLNYLGAAYAAQQRGDAQQRDSYLKEASQRDPNNRFAVGLTKARLQFQTGQLSEARETLEKLHNYAPNNVPVLRLLADVSREMSDWQGVTKLLPAMKKAKVLDGNELRERELEAYREMFENPALEQSQNNPLGGTWDSLPRAKKHDPEIVALYVRRLLETGDMAQCERILRSAIKRDWNQELVYLFGLVKSENIDKQYKLAKSWRSEHADDPDLLLTLGRIAVRKEDWEQARDYFQNAIANGGRQEAYTELGLLLEQQGEREEALLCYRQGMQKMAPPVVAGAMQAASQQLVLAGEAANEQGEAVVEATADGVQDAVVVESTANSKES